MKIITLIVFGLSLRIAAMHIFKLLIDAAFNAYVDIFSPFGICNSISFNSISSSIWFTLNFLFFSFFNGFLILGGNPSLLFFSLSIIKYHYKNDIIIIIYHDHDHFVVE